MSYFSQPKNAVTIGAAAQPPQGQLAIRHIGLLVAAACWLHAAAAQAQPRVLPSHGKNKLDSYNYMLRDVHPASQAQANYLQIRLFLTGLKKSERLERHERLDVYDERRLIKKLQGYDRDINQLAAGCPTTARSLATFWVLLSVYGDYAEVYDALSSEAPPMPHTEFVPTSRFILALEPSGELEPLPIVLEGAAGIDASEFQAAWSAVVKDLRATGRLSAPVVTEFHMAVANYRKSAVAAIKTVPALSGRLQAERYLETLGCLADALYRPQQSAQLDQYLQQGGYAFSGSSLLGLIEHMLKNRVTPAHGSAAQLALAEVARPIGRVLEQEIALHVERIDSLAAGEGHRRYAAEYRPHELAVGAVPGAQVSQVPGPDNEKL